MTPEVYLFAALISAISALIGVGVKILYDSVVARNDRAREDSTVFLAERKAAFDKFLEVNREYVKYRDKLQELLPMALRGEEPPPGALENFPESPLARLVEALDHVRRVSRTYAVIHAADSILQLHGDTATMEKYYLNNPDDPNNEISLFLLARFLEDREKEFIYAYRAELGLGTPQGAPVGYGSPKHPNLNRAEALLRSVSPAFVRKPPPGDVRR